MNTWQDLEVENPFIRPINIKKWFFNNYNKVDISSSTDTLTIKAELKNSNGTVESTPPTPIKGLDPGMYIIPSAVKFEMIDALGMEFGVGVIFEVKKVDWSIK